MVAYAAGGNRRVFEPEQEALDGPASLRALRRPAAPPAGLRERFNQPFELVADRISARRLSRGKPSLAEQLARADLKLRTSEFLMIQTGFVFGLAGVALLRFGFGLEFIIAGVAGYLIPVAYVKHREHRRRRAFNNQLVDTLALLSNSLRAGYSFPQALETVARTGGAPCADEFARAVREINLGGSAEQALIKMVRRVESDDLDLVVTALLIHINVGGDLSKVLERISEMIRDRIRIKGQISALTAQARASAWIITALPLGVVGFLYFLTPSYFASMISDPLGRVLLVAAAVSIFIGGFSVQKMARVRV